MNKLMTILAVGVLVSACVPHDPEPVTTEPEPYWQATQQPQPIVVSQPQTQPKPVIIQQRKAAQAQQPTWWKENKQKHVVKVVVPACPCKDPNDPCTHCYQK